MIPQLNSYNDLWKMVLYNVTRFKETSHPYDLVNCLLSLNALPDWLKREGRKSKVFAIGDEVEKDINRETFDIKKFPNDINHQLRFIRIFCNRAKHKSSDFPLPEIMSVLDEGFPYSLPMTFGNFILIGEESVNMEYILDNVIVFWQEKLNADL